MFGYFSIFKREFFELKSNKLLLVVKFCFIDCNNVVSALSTVQRQYKKKEDILFAEINWGRKRRKQNQREINARNLVSLYTKQFIVCFHNLCNFFCEKCFQPMIHIIKFYHHKYMYTKQLSLAFDDSFFIFLQLLRLLLPNEMKMSMLEGNRFPLCYCFLSFSKSN